MNKAKKWLYLPIDVKARELEAKALLAIVAAHKGWNVVLGPKHAIPRALSIFPKGAFIGLGALKNFAKAFAQYKSGGHVVATLDEEGLVTWSSDINGQIRLSPEATDYIDKYFTWGRKHAEIIQEKNTHLATKTVISGNPRFDILRPEFRGMFAAPVGEIKQKHGRYILINSNFGTCNHYLGQDKYFQSLWDKKIITDQKSADFYADYIAYRTEILHAFWDALPQISEAVPEHTIIVRPHPSESHAGWIDAAAGLSNVKIINEGSVIPWIMGADIVVHNFCTTAIEAFCLEKPVIAYRPIIDQRLETELPSIVSTQVLSEDELINEMKNSLKYGVGDTVYPAKVLQEYLKNYNGPMACDTILATLADLVRPHETSFFAMGKLVRKSRFRALRAKIGSFYRKSDNDDYKKHKFPALHKEELQHIIASMPDPYRGKIKLTALGDDTYLFSK